MKKINRILIFFCLFAACKDNGFRENHKNDQVNDFSKDTTINVGFLVMDGVYNTELTAPYDIFQHTIFRQGIRPMSVFLIAKEQEYITTFEGLEIKVDYQYLNDALPRVDILVIPSAEHHLDSDLEDTVMINQVKHLSDQARYVTSHCDGAFVLAQAGLLDNINCTTFPTDIDLFKDRFEAPIVHRDVWFVHDGKFITSAGGARSFEAALYVCDLFYGSEITKRLAQGLVLDYDLEQIPHLKF
jgi:transcriptional regulator GlxA family with amidase domain